MKRTKKLIATMLCASMALSTCSCAKKFENSVVDAADALGKNIVERNYKKIEKMADKGDDDLEALLSLENETDEKNIEARELIASTLKYEVDEDSYDGDFMGKEGSIDVIFTYVDYESFTDDGFFVDIDSFSDVLDDCKDTVEVTLTFDFVSDSGDCVCTNIGDIEKLFPYAEEEFNFALPPEDYAGEVRFTGLNNGNGYLDVYSIWCEVEVEGDGLLMDWEYYFVVERDSVQIYESEVMTAPAGDPVVAIYPLVEAASSPEETLDPGTYTVSFYTGSDVLIATGSVTVEETVVTPSPTPTPEPTPEPDPDDSVEVYEPGPYFSCPDGDTISLPDTDITLTLPNYVNFYDSDSELYSELVSSENVANGICFVASDPAEMQTAMCVYAGDFAYDSDRVTTTMISTADNCESNSIANGDTVERYVDEYTVGDRTFTYQTVRVEHSSGSVYYYHFGAIGDSDTTYMFFLGSKYEPCFESFMSGITIG